MIDCVRAELYKLSRRPATWILGAVYALTVLAFQYLILYLLIRTGQMDQAGVPIDSEGLLATLVPAEFTGGTVASAAGLGAPIALILGALTVGSEYAWRTVKTVAVQRPRRGAIVGGKVVAVALVLLVYAATALVSALAASLVIALLESRSTALPPAGEIALAAGASWLVLLVWAALGMALATAFRGTGLAIGLGLVWALVVESIATSLPLPGNVGRVLSRVLLGSNGTALASHFTSMSATGAPEPANTAAQAVLALGLYLLIFLAVATVPFLRRDIT